MTGRRSVFRRILTATDSSCPTLAMEGFGFDRDWGIGFYRQF